MNLPADDRPGQGAKYAHQPAAELASAGAKSPGAGEPGAGDAGAVAAEPGSAAELGTAGANSPAADRAEIVSGAGARTPATRRVLDEVFGDVLPTVTRDELDDGSDRSYTGRDQWYRDNRPPHHE